jgi:hypothetical protein
VAVTKRIALAIVSLAVTLPVGAWAAAPATPGPLLFHVEGGLGFPVAPDGFKDYLKLGPGVGAGIEKGIGRNSSLCLDVDLNQLGLNKDRIISELPKDLPISGVIIRGGSASILTVMAAIRMDLPTPGRFAPYLKLGAGLGRSSQAEANLSFLVEDFVFGGTAPARTDDQFATSIGVGLRERTPGSTVGYTLEARWVWISPQDEPTHMIPVRAGIHFGF